MMISSLEGASGEDCDDLGFFHLSLLLFSFWQISLWSLHKMKREDHP